MSRSLVSSPSRLRDLPGDSPIEAGTASVAEGEDRANGPTAHSVQIADYLYLDRRAVVWVNVPRSGLSAGGSRWVSQLGIGWLACAAYLMVNAHGLAGGG